jgi:hypothetical protein
MIAALVWSTYVTVRGSSMSRVQEQAPGYGAGLAPTVRLCIGAVLPDTPHAELTPADPSPESPLELDQLLNTVNLDP